MSRKLEKIRDVGVIVDPIGSYGRGVTRGIISYRRDQPWRLSMLRTWIFQPADFLERWSGDGLIAMISDDATRGQILDKARPTVCVSSLLENLFDRSVLADDLAIGELAARHFLDKGFGNFLFVGYGGSSITPWFVDKRRQGFTQAVSRAGHTVEAVLVQDQLRDALAAALRPVAVFTANDEIGIEVLIAAEVLGLRVPEDVAVLGVDNDDLLVESRSIGLSSIELPTLKIGYEAAYRLDRLLNDQPLDAETLMLPPLGVAARRSSDVLAINDEAVAAALAYIRQHNPEQISVSDVVAAVPLSRRSLERRFKKHLNRSLLDEIQRYRIERAGRLLLDTEMSVEQVAMASGFASRSRFYSLFSREHNMTPKQYRDLFVRRNSQSTAK